MSTATRRSHDRGHKLAAEGRSVPFSWRPAISLTSAVLREVKSVVTRPYWAFGRSETEKIRRDPALMRAIGKSIEDIREGRVYSEEEADEMIGW